AHGGRGAGALPRTGPDAAPGPEHPHDRPRRPDARPSADGPGTSGLVAGQPERGTAQRTLLGPGTGPAPAQPGLRPVQPGPGLPRPVAGALPSSRPRRARPVYHFRPGPAPAGRPHPRGPGAQPEP